MGVTYTLRLPEPDRQLPLWKTYCVHADWSMFEAACKDLKIAIVRGSIYRDLADVFQGTAVFRHVTLTPEQVRVLRAEFAGPISITPEAA